jgi:hypothetical protein
MKYVRINKQDLTAPIVKACIQAYGCVVIQHRVNAYLFPFGEHDIVAFLLRQEKIHYRLIEA